MSKSNIDKQLAQDPSGTLHAGVDLPWRKMWWLWSTKREND